MRFKIKIKIWHWLAFLWLLLFILRFELIYQYFLLAWKYVRLFFVNIRIAYSFLSFDVADTILSLIVFILLPVFFFIFKKRITFLYERLNISYAFIPILLLIFFFARIICNDNPEFSKNLSATKLLPPFSNIKVLHLKEGKKSALPTVYEFFDYKNKVIKPSFDESIIFADSVASSENLKHQEKIFYYQKGVSKEILKSELEFDNETPLITENFFLLGTDEFGRDIFVRLIYGTRISLLVGIGSVIISFALGMILGFIAGYKGGILDVGLNRFAELFLSFPVIYLVILILALFGSSIFSVVVVLGISGWMSLFKIVKSEVVSLKQKDFIITAGLIGLNKAQLLLKEILPATITPVLVNLVFLFSNVVLAEAALSYLGLGTGNLYPSWGAMISSGQEYISKAWWMIAFPGAAVVLTLFSVNSAGRKLNRLINPRLGR